MYLHSVELNVSGSDKECKYFPIGGFHVTSWPPFWWTRTKDFSLAPFVRPPAIVHCSIVICVPSDWLLTTYCHETPQGIHVYSVLFLAYLRFDSCNVFISALELSILIF